MGRRSFISATAINRMISAANARKREKERQELINSQSGAEKELPPTYQLLTVDFNPETRVTKIEIQQTQQYRTIDRYVTQNYVRYPIYSFWKTRTKLIKKTIKLTNQELENLNKHNEPLIRTFAEEIIARIGNEELFPSWFIYSYLNKEYAEKVANWQNEIKEYYEKTYSTIKKLTSVINGHYSDIKEKKLILGKKNLKSDKLNAKIQKIESYHKSVAKSVFTLFIYNYLSSEHRKQKLLKRKASINAQINTFEDFIQQKELAIVNIRNEIQSLRNDYTNRKDELDALKQRELSILSDKIMEISSLPCQLSDNSGFIPLKSFIGLAYEKIVGCYIIHNKEKDRYYVGQSKDIAKRIRQHFKGTVPNNIIFAEDYYSSSSENRENLFELKIIKCETKDELDRMEKQLIEDYDAFKSGYNGTNGNN